MIEQDWLYGFLGGVLIGLAASMFLLINGRTMGASGIIGGLVDKSDGIIILNVLVLLQD